MGTFLWLSGPINALVSAEESKFFLVLSVIWMGANWALASTCLGIVNIEGWSLILGAPSQDLIDSLKLASLLVGGCAK